MAAFTILRESCITRKYLNAILEGRDPGDSIPKSWKKWVETGLYDSLISEPTLTYRTTEEQLPTPNSKDEKILRLIYEYFKDCDRGFEHMAKSIVELMDWRYRDIDLTQYGPDGGRDAIGKFIMPCTFCIL